MAITKQRIVLSARELKALGVTLNEYQKLYRDPQTGLAWVENGSAGIAHSCHPNVEANKITRRMKEYQTWVESRGFLYNTAEFIASDDLDRLAAAKCNCGGRHA
jgi:hypothetical protein